MQNGIGIIAALAALAIWQFLIWPWIGRATRKAAQGAAEALKPAAADSGLLLGKATASRGDVLAHARRLLAVRAGLRGPGAA